MMQVLMVYKETQIAIETEIDTGIVTISYDEKPNIQALGCTAEDEPMTEKHEFIARDSDYIRHGTVTLLAGMDLVTGEIIPLVRDTHSSDDFIDFLKKVDGSYEEDRRIRIVLDNLKTHTSKNVIEYLATRPGRFEFVFTPKHGFTGQKTRMNVSSGHPDTTARTGRSDRLWRRGGPTGVRAPSGKAFRPWSRRR